MGRDRALGELVDGRIEQGAALQEKIGKGVWTQPGPLVEFTDRFEDRLGVGFELFEMPPKPSWR